MVTPVEIKRNGTEGLFVAWSDGTKSEIPSKVLRQNCPSAISRAERGDISHEKPINTQKPTSLKIVEHTASEQLELQEIWGIGNYALGVRWGDGHDSGIYSFDLLYKLSQEAKSV